jgi:ADP-dependent phosphofructokinase/glucokinase
MGFPQSAIFAFNANLDHVRLAGEEDLAAIEAFSPPLYSQMNECFSWGVQKEIAVDAKACEFFLSKIKFDKSIVGGQAGNAAEQASALGVECYLHTNYPSKELLGKFSHPERIMVAGEKGFAPSTQFLSEVKNAHHFVFESKEARTRFIASYDPFPLHPEDNFCFAITGRLAHIGKAFVGGLHLIKTPERVGKFAEEMRRWKKMNPRLQVFLELGEFSDKGVLRAVEQEVFPLVDALGLNEVELGQLSFELDELPSVVPLALFHSPQEQLVLPASKANTAALEFARRCAAFKAKSGKFAHEADLVGFSPEFVESPVGTIGLGDTFSCAYFLSA